MNSTLQKWLEPDRVVTLLGAITALLVAIKALRGTNKNRADIKTNAKATLTMAEPTNPNAELSPKEYQDVAAIAHPEIASDVVPTPETINKQIGEKP